MTLKVTQLVIALRETPSDTAPHPAGTVLLNELVVKIADAAIPGWIRVRVLGSNPTREGFIHLSDVAEQQVDTAIDADRFILAVAQSARSSESNPFYLYALAFAESGITNSASPVAASTATGPFRFTAARWSTLVQKYGEDEQITEDDRFNAFKQVVIAALESGNAIKSLAQLLGGFAHANELYLVHILGDDPATVVLTLAKTAPETPVDVPLRQRLSQNDVDLLLTSYPTLLRKGGNVATISEALDAAASALQPGLDKAATLTDQLNPPAELVATVGSIDTSAVDYTRFANGGDIKAWITAACTAAGLPVTDSWIGGYTTLCGRESSLNPNAVNTTDSNAHGAIVADGHPLNCSRGIAQCIPPTFATHHVVGTSMMIYNPIANIAASIQYVRKRYGVSPDGSDLAAKVQQADASRPPRGY
jgi:hypothetical protein